MFRIAKWAAPVVALGLLIGFTVSKVKAEEAKKETGTISGKVLDADGKAVASAKVRLFHPMADRKKDKGPVAKQEAADAGDKEKGEGADKGEKGPGNKGDRPKPVAEATADSNGEFTLADVPAGKYVLQAGMKGIGRAKQEVDVKAGETTKVDIKLEAMAAKKPK